MRRYEDLSREELIELILHDSIGLIRMLDMDHLLLIIDGVAKAGPYVPPPPEPEETWRRMLRERQR